jgi:GNAT superfamily N-acetyltransferase
VDGTITTRLQIHRAESAEEIAACRQLIIEVYRQRYGVIFSDEANPDRKLEPLPDHYVCGVVEGELVAAAGLYTRSTYAEKYGAFSEEELLRALTRAGCPEAISRPRVEYTKLVVRPSWDGLGVGRHFLAATHARDFLSAGSGEDPLLLASGKVSIFRRLYEAVGIRTHTVKPFPVYKSHERYRAPNDPMESRVTVPERDIDASWYQTSLPRTVEIETPMEVVLKKASGH